MINKDRQLLHQWINESFPDIPLPGGGAVGLDNLVRYYDALEIVLIERDLQDEYADFLRTIRKCRGKLRRMNEREYRLEQFRAMRNF